MVTITRAGHGDAAAIRDLTRAAYAKWVPVIGREPLPMRADFEHAVRHHLIALLHDGDVLAALIEMIPEGDCLLIENIAVAPEFQGRGHGRRLLAHAEELACSLGCGKIRLYTNQRFTGNVQLYARIGYAVEREEAFMGGVTVHMSKELD